MRRCRDTPDWWMSTRATMSLTGCSPLRRASTMRRRGGSARGWKTSVCRAVHTHDSARPACRAFPACGDSVEGGPRGRLLGELGVLCGQVAKAIGDAGPDRAAEAGALVDAGAVGYLVCDERDPSEELVDDT